MIRGQNLSIDITDTPQGTPMRRKLFEKDLIIETLNRKDYLKWLDLNPLTAKDELSRLGNLFIVLDPEEGILERHDPCSLVYYSAL